jgi:hypothetical protein
MTPSRVVRVVSLFLLLLSLPTLALAATTEFRVFFDVDADETTGCTVGGFDGVEQVLVTQVSDDDTTPRVTRTHRQICTGGILGGPTDVVTSGWPAVWRGSDRMMTLETRIPFSSFGSGMPESLHVGFDATRGAAGHAALANADGTPVLIPGSPHRRRAVGERPSRTIVLDGALLDWGGIDPVMFGIPGGGSKALRLLRVLSFANSADGHLYFAAQLHIASDAPFADEDEYLRTPGEEVSVPGGVGVLKNDGDPNGLPLTATKVSEAARGTVTLNPDGSFTYSPDNPASQLTDEFEYKATNGTIDSNVARVRIKVDLGESPDNGPPVDDEYDAREDKTLTVDAPGVLDNDPGKVNLVAALVTPPSHGTVVLNADGGFTYKPTLNYFGQDTFVYSATRTTSGKLVGNATVTITVERVNDEPSFTAGPNVTRPANSGPYAQTWATNISAGAPNESGQLLTFVVTNNNNSLFTVQPSIASNGVLTFTPAGTLGVATVTVFLQDNGGTANGGDNTSPTVTFTITITCGGITVTNPATTTATVGTGFSQNFTQSGAVGTATFTTSSTLPAGLTLAPNGTLSGTPTQSGTFPIVVTVTDSNGCTGVGPTYTLVVSCQTITVTNPATNTGVAGSPFSQTFTQSGALGGATFTTGSTLPAGLTLAPNGVLSGTPTQTGTFPIVVTVTDGNGCTGTGATYNLTIGCQTITVTNPATTTGTANTPFSVTFTQSGAIGTAVFTTASTLPGGLVLGANGNLAGTPTQTGSFPIVVTVTDSNGCTGTSATYTLVIGCQTITVNNPATTTGTANAPFSQTFTQTNGLAPVTFSLASGTLPAGLTLASNGVLSGTPTQTGSFPITVTATDKNGCSGTSATYNLTIGCQTITVTNPTNTTGTVNAPFSEQFTQSGAIGTATFTTVSPLPNGITLSPAGLLSGTPTQPGTFPIVVTVTDANGCTGTSATYNLIIACQVITVTNPATTSGPAGSPFSETFTQTGAIGTVTFTLASGTLPTGLTLAPTGVLSGTPTQGGTFPITVTVTDSNGCTGTSAIYNLTITCPTITVTNPSNANGTANSVFSETFTQTGGIAPIAWSLASGTLPAGLTLNPSTGVISGTPTQTGPFPITVTATDANGCSGTSGTYTITIACQIITVVNPSNANGTANSAFSETFTQTGGIGTITWSIASGTLPAGLTLNPATGVISGTPTQTGNFPVTLTATDANGCTGTSSTYTIVIGCQTITVNNPSNANGIAGSSFSETFTQTNGIGTIAWSIASGTLPAGLTLNPATGVVSGTPTQTGSFPITVTATDANSCSGTSATYTIVIGCQTLTVTNPSNANGTAGSPFSETFTQAGGIGTITWSLASGTLPAGLTLNPSTGVVSGTPTQTGSFPITVTATDANSCTGTSATYTIAIGCQTITVTNPSNATGPAGSPFSETFTQTGAIGTATFTLASGTLPTGLTLAPNGVLSGTPTQGGSFPITVTVTDANSCTGTSATYTIVITCPIITITNPANGNGTANSAFSETFSQSGGQGTITWALTTGTLPTGLTLNPATGVVSGTPTQTGSFPITVTATDGNGCPGTSSTYTITISCQIITVVNPSNANGTANSAFSETFTQTNGIGTITWSIASGTLPAGLTLNPSTGVISGTPTQTGNFPITVTATDANGCTGTSGTYTIVIGCQTITVTNPATTTGTINVAFSQTFTQSGAIGTATFTTASTLPNGLSLAPNGVLSGTPTQTGNFPIVVTVTDGNGCTGTSSTYNLVIGCQTITVTNPSNANGTVGTLFSETFTQAGAIGTATFTVASGTLPAGITLNNTTGVLSGTPTQAGNFPITVTVTDSNGCTGTSATYNLVIVCQTITVNNPANANGTVGSLFSETFTQTGGIGTTTFALASGTLPTGITLAPTGLLSGTPTQAGSFPITVKATDSNGCTGTSATYTLIVVCQVITVNNPATTTGTVDSLFTQTFTQSGGIGVVTYATSSTLPSGLTLNPATGVLSGTPGQPGNFPIVVTATDSNGCTGTSATYNLVIACQTITVTNPGVTAATYNAAFSQTFTQSGVGTHTPAVWSVTGTLPTGITLNTSTGVLSGTPTQTGTFPITVTVTDANGCAGTGATYTLSVAPVAVADSFNNGVSNTQYVLTGGTTATPSTPSIQVAGTIEVNDLPSAATVTVVPGTFATANGGSVTIAADGTFLYTPPAQPGVPASASDTFTYTVTSNTGGQNPVTSAPATVTINLTNRVWYVKNDSAAGGDGRSHQPFDTLAEAQTASTVNDIIYVYFGNGTNSGQNAGFVMKNGQKLYGQGIALVVNTQTLVIAGSRPLIGNAAGDGVTATNLTGNIIRGLNITGSDDGISMNTTGASAGDIEIADNTISGTTNFGIRAVAGSTAQTSWSIHDNSVSGTAAAMDISRTAGTAYITAFDDNVVPGTSGGGIVVTGVTTPVIFDAVPGAAINPVSGGITSIGTSIDRITNSGLVLSNVAGTLSFTDLDIFTDVNAALVADGGAGGFTFTVSPSVSTIVANAGAAVAMTDITGLDLQLAGMTSINSASDGVTLTNTTGTFTAPSGSAITNPAGIGFNINGGTVNSTYNGTITDDVGQLVVVASSTGGTKAFTGAISDGFDGDGSGISLTNNTGATIRFSGGVELSTGANTAFNATGGGTVEVCDENVCNGGATGPLVNRIATTTGIALNVANTTIGANNLEFRSIAANGAANGIVLNTTGALGGLKVKGNAAAGTGGTIQSTTGVGILMTSTTAPAFSFMNIQSSGDDGIRGSTVTGMTLTSCNLTNNGNATAENGLQLGEASGSIVGVTGTLTITNTNITGSAGNNVHIRNTSGTLTAMNITGGSFNDLNDVTGANSFLFEMSGTAVTTAASITGGTQIHNNSPQRGLEVQTHDTGTISQFTVNGASFNNNGIHASFTQDTTSNLTFQMLNNNMQFADPLHAINIFSSSTATGGSITGTVEGNTIGTAATASSGAKGNAIRIALQGRTVGSFKIHNNTIRQVWLAGAGARGMDLQFLGPTAAAQPITQSDILISNNDIDTMAPASSFPGEAFFLAADNQGSPARVRAQITGNNARNSVAGGSYGYPTFDGNGAQLVYIENVPTADGQLVDTGAASANALAELQTANPATTSTRIYQAGITLIPGPIVTPP